MLKRTFVVTREIPTPFDWYFPKVGDERMASIIRDGIEAKSISFMGSSPLMLIVEKTGEATPALGKMMEYRPEEFPEIKEAVRERARTESP